MWPWIIKWWETPHWPWPQRSCTIRASPSLQPHIPRECPSCCWMRPSSCLPPNLVRADLSATNKSQQGWLTVNIQASSKGLPRQLQSRPSHPPPHHRWSHHFSFLTGLNHYLTLPCSLRICTVTGLLHFTISSMKTRDLAHLFPRA